MGTTDDAYRALSEAVLQIASETQLEPVLLKLVSTARDLVGATYAALGTPDGHGGFSRFLTSGMSDETIEAIGPLPRTHGLLGAMLEDTPSFSTDDISKDPRFEWWPRAHPKMTSFLGVPIVAKGRVLGAFYLTDKQGAPTFTDEDRSLIELFAAHAAVAIENATLFERSRELTVVEERNRMARDLHDSVAQTLFSLSLTAEAAKSDASQIDKIGQLAKDALNELRAIVFELRPADMAAEGLVPTLVKHTDIVRRVFGQDVIVDVRSERRLEPDTELELFRIAQEALSNALRHAQASRIEVRVDLGDALRHIEVRDDGVGFDPEAPAIRARHLGLTSMEERARAIGGKLRIDAAPGRGTVVAVEVPS